MRSSATLRATALVLLFVACTRGDASRRDTTAARSVADSAPAIRVVPYDPAHPRSAPVRQAKASQPPRAAQSHDSVVHLSQTTESLGDPQALVKEYYAAIRAHDFLRAYRMWQVSGQTGGRSFAQFEAGFDSTESVDARVGAAGRVEGAAGSRFVSVPVDISARLRNGTQQHFTGTYTLRRVEVPGASAAQQKWHLYAASIRQVR